MGNEIFLLTGIGQMTKSLPAKEKEKKQQILAKLKKEIDREGSAFYKIMNGYLGDDFTLSYKYEEVIQDLRSGKFKAKPVHRQFAEELIKAYLLLDKALTVLGYKRDKFEWIGVSDKDQITWSWLNHRVIKFYKDMGILKKNEEVSSVRFGTKGLTKLMEVLGK